jgi:hypothetical protein
VIWLTCNGSAAAVAALEQRIAGGLAQAAFRFFVTVAFQAMLDEERTNLFLEKNSSLAGVSARAVEAAKKTVRIQDSGDRETWRAMWTVSGLLPIGLPGWGARQASVQNHILSYKLAEDLCNKLCRPTAPAKGIACRRARLVEKVPFLCVSLAGL